MCFFKFWTLANNFLQNLQYLSTFFYMYLSDMILKQEWWECSDRRRWQVRRGGQIKEHFDKKMVHAITIFIRKRPDEGRPSWNVDKKEKKLLNFLFKPVILTIDKIN